uniref:SDR family NAD(P)-dependent oxidoreductase n=1 Tax=Frankia sp. Cas4 TaxID=3073927 RepID=UPI002AD47A76
SVASEPAAILEPAVAPEPSAEPAARFPVELVPLPAIDTIEQPYASDPVAIVVNRGDQAGEAFALGLEKAGWTVVRANLPLPDGAQTPESTWDGEAAQRRLTEALDAAGRLDLCLVPLVGSDVWDHSVRELADAVLVARHACGPLAAGARSGSRAAFVTVTRIDGGLGHRGERQAAQALVGGVGGVVKTLAHEEPSIFCRALDIHPGLAVDDAVAVLLDEIRDAALDITEVGVDSSRGRWTIVPGPYGSVGGHPGSPSVPPADGSSAGGAATVGGDDVFVVTGGGRGVTATCIRALGASSQGTFLLLGRTALVAEPAWAAGVADGDLKPAAIAALVAGGGKPPTPREVEAAFRGVEAQREIRSTLDALTAAGAGASYIQVDVGDAEAVRAALSQHRERVTGVVHGAGTLSDGLLRTKTAEDVRRVFTPKLAGLRNVLDALGDAPVGHVVLFTSVAGLFGNAGQADYAAANEALCRVAASLKREHPDRHVTAIDWGAWDGGMVAADLRAVFRERGVELLAPDAGARMFVAEFTAGHSDDACVLIGSPKGLSAGSGPRPARGFTARRDLIGIEGTEVLQDHRIDAFPVLPATFGLGWLVNVLERAHPGLRVVEVRGFEVHKGIVFDGTQGREYQVEVPLAETVDGRLVVRASVRGVAATGRPVSHYVGTFVLAEQVDPAPPGVAGAGGTIVHEPQSGPEDGLAIYTEGILFHGPSLQGIRRIRQRRDDRVVLECRLADQVVAGGAFAGALHSPVLADVLLHGPSVLGRWLTGQACLPLAVGRFEYFAQLPDGDRFIVVLDDIRSTASSLTVTVTACDPEGRVLQRLTDVSMIGTPDMAAKFAEAVRSRQAGETA